MPSTAFNRIAIIAALAAFSTFAQAESRLSASASTGSISATAKINVNVSVPRILYLAVGSTGATVDSVDFVVGAAGITGALPVSDQAFAGAVPIGAGSVTVTDTQTANAQGTVSARLWSNSGTATLGCTSTAIASGALTLPLGDFKVTSAGTLSHPGADLSACTGTAVSAGAAGAGGISDFSGTWAFSYVPSVLPPAGTYAGTVTYTATQP